MTTPWWISTFLQCSSFNFLEEMNAVYVCVFQWKASQWALWTRAKVNGLSHSMRVHRTSITSTVLRMVYLCRIIFCNLYVWMGVLLDACVPNRLLLSAHSKDLIKMCKSMTIITIVWMDKYLPIEYIYFNKSHNLLDEYTYTHRQRRTRIHLFQFVPLFISLAQFISSRQPKIPLNMLFIHRGVLKSFVIIQRKQSSNFEFREKAFEWIKFRNWNLAWAPLFQYTAHGVRSISKINVSRLIQI